MNDRYQLEKEILAPIQSGAGLFGLSKIDMLSNKANILKKEGENVDAFKKLPQNNELLQELERDGVFVDSSQLFKNKDINVQKLEERLLNGYQKEYFKINGEIKLHNDILADELTRPADLAFEQTDAFQVTESNSIVTDRLNSFKKRYYRIDIIIGKMILKEYAALFS